VRNTPATVARSGLSHRIHLVTGVAAQEAAAPDKETAPKIRLIIASPVQLVRESLAAALRDHHRVALVDTADLGPIGMAKIANKAPDLVLVDLGQADPVAAGQSIKAASPGSRLVAFGLDETDDQVFACAAAGFSGYVPCEGGADALRSAVVDAMDGLMHCAPHIAAAMFTRLAGFLHEPEPPRPLPSLSQRESAILALVEQGRSNKEIARQLAISSATVKNHIHNLLQKLQVSRRGEAAAQLRIHHGSS
jgi:two-component system nitrate/nitrite response regulator NarL